MAQGFQDITGQIIKRVIELVHDLETSMVELIRVAGSKGTESKMVNEPDLPGPIVPGIDDKKGGIATNQDDVDDLLSSMGF
jgi:chemotaxis protein CheZ